MIDSLTPALIGALPGNFLALTHELQVVFASTGYARLIGKEKQQLEGSRLTDALPKYLKQDGPLLEEIAKAAASSQEEMRRLIHGTRQAGQTGPVETFCWRFSCKPLPTTAFLILTVEEAADQRERYRLLQEAGHIIVWDREVQLTWRSEGFFGMLGIDSAGAQASDPRLWESLLHPDDAGEVLKSIRGAFAVGALDWQAEYRLRHASGSYISVADRARVLYDSLGQAKRMVGTTIDVTERREKNYTNLTAFQAEVFDDMDKAKAWLRSHTQPEA